MSRGATSSLSTPTDAAWFTFGFGQFAAHVANGDFVNYFRAMLELPQAGDYFPHLGVIDGHVAKTDGPTPVPLEDDKSTAPLMAYLNPDLSEVQDAEVVAAAKLIHWTSAIPEARETQVKQMVATYKRFMLRADKRIGIDGRMANQCCVVADILHQGRAGKMTWPLIEAAINSSDPFEALIDIGNPRWETRTKGLKAAIKARPEFGEKRWSRNKTDFV